MSYQARLDDLLSVDRIDVTVAKTGVLLSVVLFGLWLVAEQVFFVVIPAATATGCLLYLFARERRALDAGVPTLSARVTGYLPPFAIAGLAALVVLVETTNGRTVPAYLLTGAVGAAILAQILFDESPAPSPVLAQILAASVVVRLSALFTTPGFVGVDIWTHVPEFVGGVVRTGSLSALTGSKYLMAPFYHAIGAVGALVFGAPRTGVYLSVGLLVALSALFVYATGRLFLPARWALLATALYAFADQFIRWGLHLIPTSLGLVFFLAAVYCATALYVTDAERWVVALLAVFGLATVFTHQVSTVVLLVFLGLAALVATALALSGGRSAGNRPARNAVALGGAFAVTLAATLVSWINTPYVGDSVFLWQVLETARTTLAEQAGFLNLAGGSGGGGGSAAAAASPTLFDQLVPFVDVLGFTILLAVAVLGGLVVIGREIPVGVAYTHLLAAAAMFVVVFGFSMFGIRMLLPGRWMAFMYVPMVVIGTAGLYHLSRDAPRGVVVAVLLVLVLAYPAGMAVNHSAAKDAPVFDDHHIRYSYTGAEIAAVETISTILSPADDDVHTDHPYRTLFHRHGGFEARILVIGERGPVPEEAVVYREYQSTGPSTFHLAGEPPRSSTERAFAASAVCPPSRNHVYANGQVRMCIPSGVTA